MAFDFEPCWACRACFEVPARAEPVAAPITLAPAEPEVNDELVRFLEHLSTRPAFASASSLACSGEKTGREVFSMFSGDFDVFRMLGALELLKSRIMASQVEPG